MVFVVAYDVSDVDAVFSFFPEYARVIAQLQISRNDLNALMAVLHMCNIFTQSYVDIKYDSILCV